MLIAFISADDEEYDCDILPNKKVRKKYKFRGRRLLPIAEEMNERVFKRNFRMSHTTFNALFLKIEPRIPVGESTNGMNILLKERLLIFLASIGGIFFDEFASYAHDISYGVIVASIEICINAFHDHFVDEWIKLPNKKEAESEAANFQTISGFPNIIWACLDGTHFLVSIY